MDNVIDFKKRSLTPKRKEKISPTLIALQCHYDISSVLIDQIKKILPDLPQSNQTELRFTLAIVNEVRKLFPGQI